jgi:hypothetical protein
MASQAQFAATPINAAVQISTANTARDGTGTVAILYTAPATGARIDEIAIKAGVTTTAGMVRLFLHNGSAFFLWKEVPITAITASGTVPSFEAVLGNLALVLSSGWSIRVSTNNAETFNISVSRGGVF